MVNEVIGGLRHSRVILQLPMEHYFEWVPTVFFIIVICLHLLMNLFILVEACSHDLSLTIARFIIIFSFLGSIFATICLITRKRVLQQIVL